MNLSASRWWRLAMTVAVLCLTGLVEAQQAGAGKGLRIGTSGTLFQDADPKDDSVLDTLKTFIKNETGFDNEILQQAGWNELAAKLSDGKLDLGVFPGHEFAWAQEKHAKLEPLAISVNKYRTRWAHVIVRPDSSAKGFADLKGQALSLPHVGQSHLKLFVERQVQANGAAKTEEFFGKIVTPDNFEDALDDVVDGAVSAALVDRVGLENYQRRKPGRARQLKELMKSPPFPPTVIAYTKSGGLDDDTLKRFRDGLIQAKNKEKGQKLLSFFKLTGFEEVPSDFAAILAESRKNFPPTAGTGK